MVGRPVPCVTSYVTLGSEMANVTVNLTGCRSTFETWMSVNVSRRGEREGGSTKHRLRVGGMSRWDRREKKKASRGNHLPVPHTVPTTVERTLGLQEQKKKFLP